MSDPQGQQPYGEQPPQQPYGQQPPQQYGQPAPYDQQQFSPYGPTGSEEGSKKSLAVIGSVVGLLPAQHVSLHQVLQ